MALIGVIQLKTALQTEVGLEMELLVFTGMCRQDPPWLQSAKRALHLPPFPFPYVQVVNFRENHLETDLSSDQIWNHDYAIVEPSITPTSRGLGIAPFVGGDNLYPSLFVGEGSQFTSPLLGIVSFWILHPVAIGTNASPSEIDQNMNIIRDNNGDSLTRWGDYLTIRPFAGVGPLWIASGFILQGGNSGSNVRPMYIIFGSQ